MVPKPRTVTLAEWALWAWATWACLFGFYQAWANMPELARQVSDGSWGMVIIEPQSAQKWAVLYYLVQAAVTLWFILKIGEGRHWARSSFMWCFVMEILWVLVSRLGEPAILLSDIPDMGLQAVAIYWLYTRPGADWFVRGNAGKQAVSGL